MRDLCEDLAVVVLEEASLRAKVESERGGGRLDLVNMAPVTMEAGGRRLRNGEVGHRDSPDSYCQVLEYLEQTLCEVLVKRQSIERARSRGAWARRLGWPTAMLTLIALTSITLYLVGSNWNSSSRRRRRRRSKCCHDSPSCLSGSC